MDNNNAALKESWWDAHKPTKRRIIQLYSALLYNAHLRGFAEGKIFTGKTKAVCVPGFNCYSCPGAVGACPLGSIQNALGSLNKHIGFYVLGIILLYGMLLGRTICGWLCPLGLIQELLHKIPTPKLKKSKFTRILSYLKYVILVIFVVAIPIYYGILQGIPVPGFCKYICPAGTFEGAMGMLPKNLAWLSMLGPLFTRKFVIMVIVGCACIFCYRSFCRFLCPLGAIYGMFNRLAVIGVKVDTGCCNNCGACVRKCKMDVKTVGDHECIHCAKCVAVCHQGALSMKAGNITLIPPKKAGDKTSEKTFSKNAQIACWSVAVVALIFLIVWSNFLDPTVKEASAKEQQTEEYEYAEDVSTEGFLQEYVDENGDVYFIDEAGNSYFLDDNEDLINLETGAVLSMSELTKDYDDDAGEVIVDDFGDGATEDGAGDSSFASDAPIGYEVGQQLQTFTVNCVDGSTFDLSAYRGKVVIINLWATYCGPCVQELPHFVELYHQHEDDMGMIAIHPSLTTEDVSAFIDQKGWDIQFAVDDKDDSLFKIVNGSLALPQTIVLNRKGEVIFNRVGSVTEQMLIELYQQAAE